MGGEDYDAIPLVERSEEDAVHNDPLQAQLNAIHENIHGSEDHSHGRPSNPLTTTRFTPYLCAAAFIVSMGLIFLPLGLFPLFTHRLEIVPSIDTVKGHLADFQAIADEYGGSRSLNHGYNASVNYIYNNLSRSDSLYFKSMQYFTVTGFTVESSVVETSFFEDGVDVHTLWTPSVDYNVMTYSASGIYEHIPVDFIASTGCELSHFTPVSGAPRAALVERGDCTFATKATNAQKSGYSVLVIFNSVAGSIAGTLGDPVGDILVIGTTPERGLELKNNNALTLTLNVTTDISSMPTMNLLMKSMHGSEDNVIVIGAHLDSVEKGPGINDNASGAAILIAMCRLFIEEKYKPVNQIIFAWWSAEELGLKGSTHFVNSMVADGSISRVAAYINLDMVASPNYVTAMYHAEKAPEDVRNGVQAIQGLMQELFRNMSIPYSTVAFDGRSDYAPFVSAGVPANGLQAGAEGIKTAEQRVVFGGLANAAFDPCYHLACDDIHNVNDDAIVAATKVATNLVRDLMLMDNLREFLAVAPEVDDHYDGGSEEQHD